ncbi:MAG TPA: inositol monophosphatase family protein [Candidatus Gracilibacteria bacterium]
MNIEVIKKQIFEGISPLIQKLQTWDYTDGISVDLWTHDFLSKLLEPLGYPILSEEGSDIDRPNLETFWILDPLDGTQDFLEQSGEYCVLIGLVHKGFPIFGINIVPAWDKIYYATQDQGAFCIQGDQKPIKIKVSPHSGLSQATLVASNHHFTPSVQTFADLHHLTPQKIGSNGCKIGLIAEGAADLFFNPTDKMGLWDVCALDILIAEAGGRMTDGKGQRVDYRQDSKYLPFGIVVSNAIMHQTLIDFTNPLYA